MVTQEQAELNPEEYLGRDIYLTPDSDMSINSKADLTQVRYYNNLQQAIVNRLRTGMGELPLHPNYGCRLHELIGTNPTQLTLSVAQLHIREALLGEPRVEEIIKINPIFREGTNNQVIDVDITVKPIKDLEYLNLVYSVFL